MNNQLGGFHLHVTRNLTGIASTPPPPTPAITGDYTVVEAAESNGFVSAPSLALTKPETSSKNIQTLVDKAADEGLAIIQSPRVRTSTQIFLVVLFILDPKTTNVVGGVF